MKNNYLFLWIILLLGSCVPQRKIVYVQSKDKQAEYHYLTDNKKNIRIQPFDLLLINVGSADQPGYNFFNQDKQGLGSISEASLSVYGYPVNDSGYVNLPVLGKIMVKGLTLDEVVVLIKNSTKDILSNPVVSVRFINNSVTLLGEVMRPGTYAYANEPITIFRAIGLAGDITEYGNRRKVTLIRGGDKTVHKYYLDLTKDDIFRSDYYYLRPNDILYISPLKTRRWGMKEVPFALILSLVNSAFVILVYVKLLK